MVELDTTEFSDVPVSDNLAVEPNASEVNLARRQPNQRILLTHAGFPILISLREDVFTADNFKRCALGFAVRKTSARNAFAHGFLTLGTCMHRRVWNDRDGVFALFLSLQNPGEIEHVRVGTALGLWYDPDIGMNYAVVRINPNDNENLF
jgi:hypothetical protein